MIRREGLMIRLGLLGAGFIGETHAAAMQAVDGVELTVVADANRRKQPTSGVAMGSGVADYLTEGLDAEALAALTRQGVAEAPEVEDSGIDEEAVAELSRQEQVDEAPEQAVDEDALASLIRSKRS